MTSPATLRELPLKKRGFVEDLDDSELSSVIEFPTNNARLIEWIVVTGCRRLVQQAVDEEHNAVWLHGRLHRCPERVEPFWRDVRKPEPEEGSVKCSGRRSPIEHVCHNVLNPIRFHSLPIDGDGFRRSVNSHHALVTLGEPSGPQASAAREFKNVARCEALLESRFDRGHFSEPSLTVARSTIVPPLSEEPLVVLARSCPVVPELFPKEFFVLHVVVWLTDSFSRGGSLSRQPRTAANSVSAAPRP